MDLFVFFLYARMYIIDDGRVKRGDLPNHGTLVGYLWEGYPGNWDAVSWVSFYFRFLFRLFTYVQIFFNVIYFYFPGLVFHMVDISCHSLVRI